MSQAPKIGILALQGDFEAHREKLKALGADTILVRKAVELSAVQGLVIPGGESSTMLRLMSPEFRTALAQYLDQGLPVFSTCAGTILLAKEVKNPEQFSFGALDISVVRNGYGRQIDSFVQPSVEVSQLGRKFLAELDSPDDLEGVFIRAPIINRVGPKVEILATDGDNPILVRSGALLAATFHPELSHGSSVLHRLFLASIRSLQH